MEAASSMRIQGRMYQFRRRQLRQGRRASRLEEFMGSLGERAGATAERVLIYRIGSLGDMVVALPALHLVARAFPRAERKMLTNFPVDVKAAPAATVLENTGLVSGYFRYAVGRRSFFEIVRLWWTLRRWRPEVLVYLAPNRGAKAARRDAAFFRLCGIRTLLGVPLTEMMERNLWDESTQSLEFEAKRLARNLEELGEARLEAAARSDV